jgi:hypothetical protein
LLLCGSICHAQSSSSADRSAVPNVPANPARYTPMTEAERLRQYLRDSVSPVSFLTSAASAGIGQWRDRPTEWPQGASGYSERFGSSFAEHMVRQSLLLGLSSALQEDDRYVQSGLHGVKDRTSYAVSRTFLARRNDGSEHFSFSKLGACAGASLLSRLWQPRSARGPGSAGVNFGASIAGGIGLDVLHEFWPGKH